MTRRARGSLLLAEILLLVVVAACGGGGGSGGGDPPADLPLDLGLVASTAPTTVVVAATNPFDVVAVISLASSEGPFAPAAGALPTTVGPRATVLVSVVVAPAGATGPLSGAIVFRFTPTAGAPADVRREIVAVGEPVATRVAVASLGFGDVDPGTSRDRVLVVFNDSVKNTVTIAQVDVSGSPFSVATPLPVTAAPGGAAALTLRMAPAAPGTFAGSVAVTTVPGFPHVVSLSGTSSGEVETDLGSLSFDAAGLTSAVTFDVPSDAISFLVEARCDAGTVVGLGRLEAPGGIEYENESTTGTYLQLPDTMLFAAQVPNTDRAADVVRAGTWTLRLKRFEGSDADATCRVIVERRPAGTGSVGRLDLNVWFAPSLGPSAASAPTDPDVTAVLARASEMLGAQGVSIGDVDFYDLAETAYDDVTYAEFGPLLSKSADAVRRRLNYFWVRTAIGGGILGISATIGGGVAAGTEKSGVMGLWIETPDAAQRELVALVMAHEMGHFLGLYHTCESDESHDRITDTIECPWDGCAGTENDYLMHWQADGGAIVTPGQGLVLRGHPLIAPAPLPGGSPARAARPPPPSLSHLGIPSTWCGTKRSDPGK
jgi:hypothetical protein